MFWKAGHEVSEVEVVGAGDVGPWKGLSRHVRGEGGDVFRYT